MGEDLFHGAELVFELAVRDAAGLREVGGEELSAALRERTLAVERGDRGVHAGDHPVELVVELDRVAALGLLLALRDLPQPLLSSVPRSCSSAASARRMIASSPSDAATLRWTQTRDCRSR